MLLKLLEMIYKGVCNGLSGVFPANRCRLLQQDDGDIQTTQLASSEQEQQTYHSQDQTAYSSQQHDRNQGQHQDEHDVPQRCKQDARGETAHSRKGLHGLDQPTDRSTHGSLALGEAVSTTNVNASLPPSTAEIGLRSYTHLQHVDHISLTSSSSSPASTFSAHANVPQVHSPPPEPPMYGPLDTEEVLLPPNWSATTNSKGRLYYYNVLTKETSWRLPSTTTITTIGTTHPSAGQELHTDHVSSSINDANQCAEMLSQDPEDHINEEYLPEGWNSAQDEDGSQYFFNESTGETTWDRPTSPGMQRSSFQSSLVPEASSVPQGSSPVTSQSSSVQASASHSAARAAPKRQPSIDENMLQNQLLGLSLSEEELHALELSQLPPEKIQRKGSLRVKSQKVSTNATISSWKEYWVVVYKGFLLFYRDDGGVIRSTLSLKASSDSINKVKQVMQVMPAGCFDVEKITIELPANGQSLTKKKNVFHITPGSSVRLLLQDASGGDERAWFRDIQASLASRKVDEISGLEEPYLIQILKRQTAGSGEASGLKMNKKIEEKDLKTYKGPLKMEKTRGIRNMVAQGIHVPRRKSGQDERLRLSADEDVPSATQQTDGSQRTSTSRPFTNLKNKSSSDQFKDSTAFRKDGDGQMERQTEIAQDIGSPGSGVHHGKKTRLTNMSRNFFSKDKDKDKEREKERDKEKDKEKEKSKDRIKEKYKDKGKDKDSKHYSGSKSVQGGSPVFGGSLTVEPGRTIPKVVELCVKTIEARGLSTAGIYRVSGHMGSIQNMKRAFNEGSNVEKLIDKEHDVNTIAALLKLYFRELREPVMLFDFYPSFIAAADIEDYNEKLYTIKSLVHSLPEPNFNTLQYLMMHLGRVQDQYHTTKMDSANLAICFAPNLLRQEVNDLTSIINTGKQSSIIDTLIEQREWVFDPYPEEDEDEIEEVYQEAQLQDHEQERQQSQHHIEQGQQSHQDIHQYQNEFSERENTTAPPAYVEPENQHPLQLQPEKGPKSLLDPS
ncbi:Rho GTPase-activating protein 21 [Haplosporangium sp. Z 767]|nr:Rho GTPase-activating protein 21 [Haplosporangium sp. Z 767]